MACNDDLIEYICKQLEGVGNVCTKKMFGEVGVYVDEKMVMMVCDNIAYIKQLSELKSLMKNAEIGVPYPGAKEHYILDVDHKEHLHHVIKTLWPILPYPKKRVSKKVIIK